ncbi:MAG TPA: iron-containing redox enzyme family protein [Mycobacteriales bacterium]|nr:iron-containing redox enzyme family protein [Mycobacteriales bacterium]
MELLSQRLALALQTGALDVLRGDEPATRRDRSHTLLRVYDLLLGDVAAQPDRARLAGHPALADLKWRLESQWLDEMYADDADELGALGDDAVAAMRALAAKDRLPGVYEWVAREASYDDLVRFLALEGGPDGGFDDLVAACQMGLSGRPKLELAQNYWDEMGNGRLAAVHTTLHDDLVTAIDMPRIPLSEQPDEALERSALGGLLATNHWLQPEMLGALGLIELQAGPRCRKVLAGLERTGAPQGAIPFYAEHAEVDPRHGKDWMDNAIVPYVEAHPDLSSRVLRGALWRSRANAAFFARLGEDLGTASRKIEVAA